MLLHNTSIMMSIPSALEGSSKPYMLNEFNILRRLAMLIKMYLNETYGKSIYLNIAEH